MILLKTHGLLTYARNNTMKSAALLLGYVGVAIMMSVAISLMVAITTTRGTLEAKYASAWRLLDAEWLHMLCVALLWVGLASLRFQKQVGNALQATPLERRDNPSVYNLVENLSIACGIPMPGISIIETPATNAFMTGFTITRTHLTLSRGLLVKLNQDQLKAVIAHELTKVMTRDTRYLSLATVVTSICVYVASFIFKPFYKPGFRTLVLLLALPFYPYQIGVVMAAAALAALASAVLIKLSISKLRTFVADAGACEITKDPASLIAALRIINSNDQLQDFDLVCRPLLFSAPKGLWFSSTPDTQARVEAIKTYVGEVKDVVSLRPPLATPPGDKLSGLRKELSVPSWVDSPWIMVPVLALALFFTVTTSWRLADREEVARYRDSIQASLEYAARVAGSTPGVDLEELADQQEKYYGLKLDRAKLRKIAATQVTVDTSNTAFVLKAAPDDYAPKAELQSVIFAAAKSQRAMLVKAISDAAYKCAYDLAPGEMGKRFGAHWARSYGNIGNFPELATGHFPSDSEIEASLIKEAGGNYITPPDIQSSAGADTFYMAYWDKNYAASSLRNACVFGNAYTALKDKVTIASDTPQPTIRPETVVTKTESGLNVIDLNSDEGRRLEQSIYPTPEEQQLISKLDEASWNQGSVPTMRFWIPAAILMMFWQLLKIIPAMRKRV